MDPRRVVALEVPLVNDPIAMDLQESHRFVICECVLKGKLNAVFISGFQFHFLSCFGIVERRRRDRQIPRREFPMILGVGEIVDEEAAQGATAEEKTGQNENGRLP